MTTAEAAPLPPEFAALAAQGAELDAEQAPPQTDTAGNIIQPTDYNAEAAMLIKALVGIAAPFFPSVARIWTDAKQSAVAAAAAPVMAKHGFTLGDFMSGWKEEITLAVVAGPLVLETIDGIKADRRSASSPSKPAAEAPAADPAAPGPMFSA